MTYCEQVIRALLTDPVDLRVDEPLDFKTARLLAADPMLLAWYDGISGRLSPNVTCCIEKNPVGPCMPNRGEGISPLM